MALTEESVSTTTIHYRGMPKANCTELAEVNLDKVKTALIADSNFPIRLFTGDTEFGRFGDNVKVEWV